MESFPIFLFVLVVVCLAVASEAQTTQRPATTTTKTPATTARTTSSSVKPTTTSKTTVKPTTTTTSKTTSKTTTTKPVTSTTTVKPSSSTTVRTTSTKPATTTTTAKPTTVKTTVKTTSSPSTTTAKKSTVSTTQPTTTTTKKTTTSGTTPGRLSSSSTKSGSTLRSTSTSKASTTTRTTSTLVPPTTARTRATPTTTVPTPVLFNCSVSDPACGNMCGDVTSTTSGVVQSPNFPGDYGNNSWGCVVSITAPAEWMIQLNFTTFNVETDVCSVYVNDDFTYLLPRTTGNTIPAIVPASIGRMNIYFACDNSRKTYTAVYNWRATFSVTSQGSSCSMMYPSDCDNMCTNVTSAGSGAVQSPNFPGDYGNSSRQCEVIVVVPAGKRIRLTFTTFNAETGKAYVSVIDRRGFLLENLTGSKIPAVVTTVSNILYLLFFSYTSTKPNTKIFNWQATYTAVTADATSASPVTTTAASPTTKPPTLRFNCSVFDPGCEDMCGDVTSPSTGVVQSSNFPGDYGNNSRNCEVIIAAPEGWIIKLNFTSFNVETDVCYVSVIDDFTVLLPSTTGNTIPAIFPATIGSMNINFACDNSNKTNATTYNWRATFSVTSQGSFCSVQDPAGCGTVCNNVTSAGSGVVQSPNFPHDYRNSSRVCLVSVIVPAGKRIRLAFTNFSVPSGDYFSVGDRETLYVSDESGSTIPAVVTTTSNILYLQFISYTSTKPTTAIYNWRATYTAV